MKKGRIMRPFIFVPINCRASLVGQQKRATDCASHLSFAGAIYAKLREVIRGNSQMLDTATGLGVISNMLNKVSSEA